LATPEEAARGGLRKEFVRVVGVVVRGDDAVVAQIMNADGFPDSYEIETVRCHRTRDGWEEGHSGNHNITHIRTAEDRCTVIWWAEAPEGATSARIRLGSQEQTVGIVDGFFFVVFDDVPWREFRGLTGRQWPREPLASPVFEVLRSRLMQTGPNGSTSRRRSRSGSPRQ
jgi:hypothetical protein